MSRAILDPGSYASRPRMTYHGAARAHTRQTASRIRYPPFTRQRARRWENTRPKPNTKVIERGTYTATPCLRPILP